ncbi:MAG: phasin family protein [Proteobacteria bacterium]|nr:phasin family protein [Pseudomonadota bacterium]
MYQQINEQFTAASRQFADTAAQVNRLALENAEKVFGLQLTTIEENVNATFAFWGELANVRDLDTLKAVWPKGVQVARENLERTISTSQEVYGNTVKTNEAIGQIAKTQVEAATAAATEQAKTVAEKVVKTASKK